MLMQNFWVVNKELYGMLWYYTTSYFCHTSLDLTPNKSASDTKPLTTYDVFRAHFA